MKKLVKWLFGILVTVVLLLVLAVLLLPILFDPNDHKPEIQQAVQNQIGREVSLNGPIGWSVFPWIAIELNDVTVANERDFSGDSLADIGTLSARVKLMPLLKKDIQVDTVELMSPRIHLQVAQSGQSNWQSIMDHLASEDETAQSDTKSNIKINIEGIKISAGQLNYRDAAAGSTLKLSDLNFSSTAITAGKPAEMTLKGQLEMVENKLSADLSSDFVVNHLLSEQAMVVDIKSLALAGEMDGIPLKVRTQKGGQLDLGQDSLKIPEINIEYANVRLKTPLTGTHLSSQTANYSGQVTISSFNVAEFLQQLGGGLDNQAANQLSASTDWSMRGQVLTLNNIKAQLDDSELTGQVTISDLERMAGDFKLNLNHINLDDYLPQTESEATVQDSEDAVDFGYLDGEITIGRLTAMGTSLDNVKLHMTTRGSELNLRPLTAVFYQGLLKTELTLAPDKVTDKLVIKHSMQDIQAGPLLTDLMGNGFLSGLGQLQADIRVSQLFAAAPLRSANGHLSYHLSDGEIKGIDLVLMTQKALSLLNKSEAAEANKALETEFGSMALEADVVDGVIKTKQLALKSPYFDLIGDVEVDLVEQSIKGTIQPMLINIPPGVLDARFERLLNHRIPVSLSGSMLAPNFGIDIKQLLINTQKEKIEAKKEELKQELFDSLLGKDKKSKEKLVETKQQAVDDNGENKAIENADETTDETVESEAQETPKEDSKDRLKRELLEGLFKKSKKEPEPDKSESEPGSEPQPDTI
ncbi:AsmA family protein [Marinicella gelatinilytica]|uniref:AsmA family protein n=1 Tax=Marinicella gelatinilytica TaxID=2996017 RepID=UPI002260BB6D|nr:AsmA family protein [Marinicella gelatinilytica]MCX7545437.1 AsmA family protein [Marinicella gelatinilytica]